ncbi:MAG TPA: AzlC family ABC transporter permease [Syntrophomonadaceae bacterium]|nr:AzlC family ABC transporter permease [Syntrophomonadaceae bacterium]HPU48854.1 AzlC family ABC transporter permease [Syntrophomonadaceae bacterium]
MDRFELKTGAKDAVPVVLGYLPLGFAFGVLATQAGMTVIQATAMSILCFTGAGQYIALGVIQAQGAVITAVIANLLVNVRYFLFTTSMVPFLKNHVNPVIASILSYGVTDETYAVAMNRYQSHPPTASYMAGLNLTAHLGWISSTLLGAVLGSIVTNTDRFGLAFALPAMYICLLVLLINRKSDVLIALFSAILCLVIGYVWPWSMSNMFNIVIATIAAATLGVMIREQ